MRLTMPDLIADQHRIQDAIKRQFAEIDAHLAEVEQPADPFDGMGDFEIHPAAFELNQERAARRLLMDELMQQASALGNIEAILDRPLSKLKNKELVLLIRTVQDVLADFNAKGRVV